MGGPQERQQSRQNRRPQIDAMAGTVKLTHAPFLLASTQFENLAGRRRNRLFNLREQVPRESEDSWPANDANERESSQRIKTFASIRVIRGQSFPDHPRHNHWCSIHSRKIVERLFGNDSFAGKNELCERIPPNCRGATIFDSLGL